MDSHHQGGWRENRPLICRAEDNLRWSYLFIPCLNRGLMRNQTIPELEHGEAIHLRTVGIGAGLSEGKVVAVRDGGFDLVRHGTAAHVVPKHVY